MTVPMWCLTGCLVIQMIKSYVLTYRIEKLEDSIRRIKSGLEP
jgi:hypothetical protein